MQEIVEGLRLEVGKLVRESIGEYQVGGDEGLE